MAVKINKWRYESHPIHLIVATLPVESGNTENIILQWDILLKKMALQIKQKTVNVNFAAFHSYL